MESEDSLCTLSEFLLIVVFVYSNLWSPSLVLMQLFGWGKSPFTVGKGEEAVEKAIHRSHSEASLNCVCTGLELALQRGKWLDFFASNLSLKTCNKYCARITNSEPGAVHVCLLTLCICDCHEFPGGKKGVSCLPLSLALSEAQ